jgi:hypothetical protein
MSTPQPEPRQEQEQVVYAPVVPESHPLRAEDVPALLAKRIA